MSIILSSNLGSSRYLRISWVILGHSFHLPSVTFPSFQLHFFWYRFLENLLLSKFSVFYIIICKNCKLSLKEAGFAGRNSLYVVVCVFVALN